MVIETSHNTMLYCVVVGLRVFGFPCLAVGEALVPAADIHGIFIFSTPPPVRSLGLCTEVEDGAPSSCSIGEVEAKH